METKFEIKKGDRVKADPRLTGLDNWVEGEVIDIERNPFKGIVIAIKDTLGRIFFGEEKYFKFSYQPMFAISFDMTIYDLKVNFGDPYHNAYYEISKLLRKYDFYNAQGSLYLTKSLDMANLFRAMNALKEIEWFRNSVRDIRAFKVEDWSDFTPFFQEI